MQQNRYEAVKNANYISGLANFSQAVLKVIVGFFGHSPALFADGIHSFSDLLANILVWGTNKVAHIAPDQNHPYGHGRFETFGSLFLGLFLIATAGGIAADAVVHIVHHTILKPHIITLAVAILSVALNESVFRYSIKTAERVQSSLLRANAYHNRADSLSAFIVIIGISGTLLGIPFMDASATILVAGFILKIGLGLSWKALYELSDAGLPDEQTKAFEHLIVGLSGVRQMHRLRSRKMGDRIFLDLHILIEPYASASEGHYIAETVHYHLKAKFNEIEDIVVHVDTEDHPERVPDRLMPSRREIETAILPILPQADFDAPRITLFYFREYIEMSVTLPLSLLQINPYHYWHDKITDAATVFTEITNITVQFEAIPRDPVYPS